MQPEDKPNFSQFSRRDLLKGFAGLGAVVALSSCALSSSKISRRDLIRKENQKPGTRDWLLTNTRIDRKTKYRCPWIEGYCSHTSIRAGETLQIFVSTNPPSPVTIDIFRMGHYGGQGGRRMMAVESFQGMTQREPEIGPRRLRECKW